MSSHVPLTGRARAAGLGAGLLALAMLGLPGAAQAAPPEPAAAEYVFSDLTGSPVSTDYDHREVTLSGTLLRHDPAGGPGLPAAGETVDLVQWIVVGTGDPIPDPDIDVVEPLGTVTTDAQGRFRLADAEVDLRDNVVQAPPPGPFTVPVFALRRTDPATYGMWDVRQQVDITGTPSQSRLTVDYRLSAPAAAGRDVTAEGLYERRAGSRWKPVAGITVTVDYQDGSGNGHFSRDVRTGADGRFRVTFRATVTGTVSAWADWTEDPYLDPAQPVSRAVTVPAVDPATTPPPTRTPAPTGTATTAPVPTVPATTAPAATAGPTAGAPAPSTAPVPETTAPAPGTTPAPDGSLATTGESTPLAGFVVGGSALAAAGILLAMSARRMRRR